MLLLGRLPARPPLTRFSSPCPPPGLFSGARHCSADPSLTRLNKRMRDDGLCSRREADAYISTGRVSVNGLPAALGTMVTPEDIVELHPSAAAEQQHRLTIALHKPMGYISQAANPRPYQRYAWQLLEWKNQSPNCTYGAPSRPRSGSQTTSFVEPRDLAKLAVCGRLDVASTGLLILSQDGRTANAIIGEHSAVAKTYVVECECDMDAGSWEEETGERVGGVGGGAGGGGRIGGEGMADVGRRLELLRHGLELDGELLRPAEVELVELKETGDTRREEAWRGGETWGGDEMRRGGGTRGGDETRRGRKARRGEETWRGDEMRRGSERLGSRSPRASVHTRLTLSMVLQQGKYRQIRRMCELVGMTVSLSLTQRLVHTVPSPDPPPALGDLPHTN